MGPTHSTTKTITIMLLLSTILSGCVARSAPITTGYDALAPSVNAIPTNTTYTPPPPPTPLTGLDLWAYNLLGDWAWYYLGVLVLGIVLLFFSPKWGGALLAMELLVWIVRQKLI